MSRRRGSIRRRGVTWTWYLDGEPDPLTGKRRQLSKGGYPSEKAAQDGLDEAVARRLKGTLTRPSRLTLAAYLTGEWLPATRARLRPNTYANYRNAVEDHIVPLLGTVKLQALTPARLQRFYAHLLSGGRHRHPADTRLPALLAALASGGQAGTRTAELLRVAGGAEHEQWMYGRLYALARVGKAERVARGRWRLTVVAGDAIEAPPDGLAPKTVRNVHGVLHAALDDAVRWGYVLRNVADAVDPPRVPGGEQLVWAPEQLRAFLNHVRGDRLYALWLLAVTTGMRRGELAGLRRQDLDLTAATVAPRRPRVVVDGQAVVSEPKSRKGRRSLALDPATAAALRDHLAAQDAERARLELSPASSLDLVFTWPDGRAIHPARITRWFQQHARTVGLPVIRLHDVRHSYATAALKAGAPPKVVSERLGHATVAFTMDVYAHVIPGMDAETANLVADMVIGSTDDGRHTAVQPSPADESVDNDPDSIEPGEEVEGERPAQGDAEGTA